MSAPFRENTLHISYCPETTDRGTLFLSLRSMRGFDLLGFYYKYVFARFSSPQLAQEALLAIKQSGMHGIVSALPAKQTYNVPYPQPSDQFNSSTLHVTHLPQSHSKAEMLKIFSIFTPLHVNFYGKYVYIYFLDQIHAMRARHLLRNETNLVVSFARNPPRPDDPSVAAPEPQQANSMQYDVALSAGSYPTQSRHIISQPGSYSSQTSAQPMSASWRNEEVPLSNAFAAMAVDRQSFTHAKPIPTLQFAQSPAVSSSMPTHVSNNISIQPQRSFQSHVFRDVNHSASFRDIDPQHYHSRNHLLEQHDNYSELRFPTQYSASLQDSHKFGGRGIHDTTRHGISNMPIQEEEVIKMERRASATLPVPISRKGSLSLARGENQGSRDTLYEDEELKVGSLSKASWNPLLYPITASINFGIWSEASPSSI